MEYGGGGGGGRKKKRKKNKKKGNAVFVTKTRRHDGSNYQEKVTTFESKGGYTEEQLRELGLNPNYKPSYEDMADPAMMNDASADIVQDYLADTKQL